MVKGQLPTGTTSNADMHTSSYLVIYTKDAKRHHFIWEQLTLRRGGVLGKVNITGCVSVCLSMSAHY